MARLPQPGGDSGNWGQILNDFLSQTLNTDGSLKNGAVSESQLDTAVQTKLNSVGSGTVSDGTITTQKLADNAVTSAKIADGTIINANIGASAAIDQSKITNLVSDLAGKAAAAHTHTSSQIADSTATGRSILTATDATAARSAIGAGTSNLVIGTTSTTAKAGDYVPTKADVGLGNVDNTSDATKNSASVALTNKTISGSSNTLTNIPESAVTNLVSDLSAKVDKSTAPIRFAAAVALTGVTPTDRAYVARTLTGARMRVASAPSGSALTAQVQHYNGTSWSTIGTVTIASGSVVESVISFSQSQALGDLLRLNVTSIGSSTAATGVVVDVLWT